MSSDSLIHPSWQALYETAAPQEGYFTSPQAARAGFSAPLLTHHRKAGRLRHVRRGIYRLVQFPAGDHEDLVTAWLWSEAAGVFSHQTALSLHQLSDAMPETLHVTMPTPWRSRRLRVPTGIALHYGDIAEKDRSWIGPVPVTSVLRTLRDCARDGLTPDLMLQALRQALDRGLVRATEVQDIACLPVSKKQIPR